VPQTQARLGATRPARAAPGNLQPPPRRPLPRRRARRARRLANNVELVPTPTYASFLNRIESHFGAIDEFVCKNSDYLDWKSHALAIAEHIRHRNTPEQRAQRRIDAAKRRQRRAARQTLKLAA